MGTTRHLLGVYKFGCNKVPFSIRSQCTTPHGLQLEKTGLHSNDIITIIIKKWQKLKNDNNSKIKKKNKNRNDQNNDELGSHRHPISFRLC